MVLSVQEKLTEILSDGPLTVAAIKEAYRRRYLRAAPTNLAVYLDSVRFVRRPGDRYMLAEHADAEELSNIGVGGYSEQVTLFSMPRLLSGDFAVVDVETTGIDPAEYWTLPSWFIRATV